MIASRQDIKTRIEELKLSHTGYTRQLGRPGLSEERRERLLTDVAFLQAELGALDKVLQLCQVEPDAGEVQRLVEERLAVLAQRFAGDPRFAELEADDLGLASGEARALLWAVGRDKLTLAMQDIMQHAGPRDPSRIARALPAILLHALQEAPDPDARASAAYELGKLGVREAIPALEAALHDRDGMVAQVAFRSLVYFSDSELLQANVDAGVLEQVRAAHVQLQEQGKI